MNKNIEYIGEGIDRLVTLDVRARGVIYNLYNAARTEGPIGAAALARSLNIAFEINPIIITEEQSRGVMASTLRA